MSATYKGFFEAEFRQEQYFYEFLTLLVSYFPSM